MTYTTLHCAGFNLHAEFQVTQTFHTTELEDEVVAIICNRKANHFLLTYFSSLR